MLTAVVCLASCIFAAPQHSGAPVVTISLARDAIRVPDIPGWSLYGTLPSTAVRGVSLIPASDRAAPISSISFRLLPPSTTKSRVLKEVPLRGSVYIHSIIASVGGSQRRVDCRRGDIVNECFVLVPLRDSVLEAALTVARSKEDAKYLPIFERQFSDALSRLKLP